MSLKNLFVKTEDQELMEDDLQMVDVPAKVNHVKVLQKATEKVLRNVISESNTSSCFPSTDVTDSLRYNVEQDIKDLIAAHAQFEQFFMSQRLIYTQLHPEKVLEARIKEMKRALVRKDELIRCHHKNLDRWSGMLRHGIPQTGSTSDRAESSQATSTTSAHNESPTRNLSAQQRMPSQPVGAQSHQFHANPRVLSPPHPVAPFSYAMPSAGNFGVGGAPPQVMQHPGFRQQLPPQQRPAPPYQMPRTQSPGVGYPLNQNISSGMYTRSASMNSLSAMLSQTSPGPILPQHQMRSASPNLGGAAISRMPQWRPGMPPQPTAYNSEEPEMYNPHLHGSNPNIHGNQ